MAKRRCPPVTLAPIKGSSGPSEKPAFPPVAPLPAWDSDRAALQANAKVAERAIRGFRAMGYRAGEAPTPERLLRAGGDAAVQPFSEVVEVSRGSKFEPTAVDMVRIRLTDSPFDRLCTRGLLAPGDKTGLNLRLSQAGIRYREAWRGAGLEGVQSVDFGRVGVSSSVGLFKTEYAAASFQLYARIRAGIARDYQPTIDAIVLFDRDPVDVGRQISPYKAEKQAIAVALHDLRRGLEAAARVLGLIAPLEEPRYDASSGDDVGKNPGDGLTADSDLSENISST